MRMTGKAATGFTPHALTRLVAAVTTAQKSGKTAQDEALYPSVVLLSELETRGGFSDVGVFIERDGAIALAFRDRERVLEVSVEGPEEFEASIEDSDSDDPQIRSLSTIDEVLDFFARPTE